MVRICFLLVTVLIAALWTGTSAAQTSGSLLPVGQYGQLHQDGEHCIGYEIDLWRSGAKLYGLWRSCAGLTGDHASAVLEDVVYSAGSGALSFTARLSQGSDYLGGGRQVPSQDVYTFRGRISAGSLRGQLTHTDRVYDGKGSTSAAIQLRREKAELPSYPSEAEWRSQAK